MFDADAPLLQIALAVGLLAMAPLAGCLEPIGEATQDALVGPNASQTTSSGAAEAEEVEVAAIEDTLSSSFVDLDPDEDEIPRRSMSFSATPVDGDGEFHMGVLFDGEQKAAIISFEGIGLLNETSDNASSGMGEAFFSEIDGMLFAQVHQTAFVGSPSSMIAVYNESTEWETEASNLTELDDGPLSMGGQSNGSDSLDPGTIAENITEGLEDLPDEATVTEEEITYQSQPASELHLRHENETDAIDLRVVIEKDPERLRLLEGTVQTADEEPPFEDGAEIEATFDYGESVDHRYRDDLDRLASMTILSAENVTEAEELAVNETRERTVQPSHEPGIVPVEDAEVHLVEPMNSEGPALELPAEEGSLATDEARLVYDDVDGDGYVSPGDEVRFTPLSAEATGWSLAMYDEETRMRTMIPAPSAAFLVAALAGLALALRRRAR